MAGILVGMSTDRISHLDWQPELGTDGIVGGLSVLGTTGVVVPYSCSAWIDSIRRGIDVAAAEVGEAYPVEVVALAADLARMLVHKAGLLLLPGTMFMPDGDAEGARHVRIAFANADVSGIAALVQRLQAFRP